MIWKINIKMLVSALHFYDGLVSNLSPVLVTTLFIVFYPELTFVNKCFNLIHFFWF